jgi:LPPG:FO 2-phospho-L-lactate transferase
LVTLAGGVGAARLLAGLVQVVEPSSVVVIVNTGDDTVLHGLHVSPDLDTVTYTLAGVDNRVTGWGMADETWRVMESLEHLGGETWFRLGDRDLATHLYRTGRLAQGATLTETTAELARRWGLEVRLLPMSDDPVPTHVTLAQPDDTGRREVGFQDYFVRLAHAVPVSSLHYEGADQAQPAPGVLEALDEADHIVICPSNPLVSIGPILALPEIRARLCQRRHDVVAVSPIVAGAALKGPADRLLRELGYQSTVVGVARFYADTVGTLVIDTADAELADDVRAQGIHCVVAPTVMSTSDRARELAEVVMYEHGARR